MWFKKASLRRQAIREDVAEMQSAPGWFHGISGQIIVISWVFFLVATAAQFWPLDPPPFQEGEHAPMDLRAPVAFSLFDPEATERMKDAAKAMSPPVLLANQAVFDRLRSQLSALKQDVQGITTVSQLSPEAQARFPGLTDNALRALQSIDVESYESGVRSFLNQHLWFLPLVTRADREFLQDKQAREVRLAQTAADVPVTGGVAFQQVYIVGEKTTEDEFRGRVRHAAAEVFPRQLIEPMVSYVMGLREPTFKYDAKLTVALADRSAEQIIPAGLQSYPENQMIVKRGDLITGAQYRALREAQRELQRQIARDNPWSLWMSRLGRALVVLIITIAGALYVAWLSKIGRSSRQGWAVCGLLLTTLVLAKTVVAFAPQSVFLVGLMPTLLTTIILVIAYNQRFALGLGALHGLLVTVTLGQGIDFFMPLLTGVAVFSFGLAEIRTRSKLIEVGFIASAAIFGAVWATGLAQIAGGIGRGASGWNAGSIDIQWVRVQSLWAVGSGVFVAMFVMGILPSIERTFNMTTAMTLLELCDASKPLLRRLSQEAAGTFNHSLTVGIMAEAAGNAVGANGLLCRVGAYYHDVGKLSKPQYFIENQTAGGPNRHDKLSPAMSLLIIVGHVKDGIELAREYGLPWVVHQFIAQHHGTTLVEYFFHAAKKRAERDEDAVAVSDSEFRYPGPKPQTPEAAIVMICDGCESVVRSIDGPNAGRIESAVHNMIMKRLMDGQFSECDLTLRDLSVIEETLVRTLVGIYHGRVSYPSPVDETIGGDAGISQPA